MAGEISNDCSITIASRICDWLAKLSAIMAARFLPMPGISVSRSGAYCRMSSASAHPMGFLVVGNGQVKMLPTNYATPVDRVMELLPEVMGEIKNVLGTGESAEPPVQ